MCCSQKKVQSPVFRPPAQKLTSSNPKSQTESRCGQFCRFLTIIRCAEVKHTGSDREAVGLNPARNLAFSLLNPITRSSFTELAHLLFSFKNCSLSKKILSLTIDRLFWQLHTAGVSQVIPAEFDSRKVVAGGTDDHSVVHVIKSPTQVLPHCVITLEVPSFKNHLCKVFVPQMLSD